MAARVLLLLALAAALAFPQSKYTGPRPPKPDIPYLLQADRLIETEAVDAKEETKKDDTIYSVPGAASSAKTPLAEPAFLFEAKNVQPDRLQLYKLESKNGRREILMKRKRPQRPVHLSIKRLAPNLYRIEANEYLENGEYSFSPTDSNQVFCFSVY